MEVIASPTAPAAEPEASPSPVPPPSPMAPARRAGLLGGRAVRVLGVAALAVTVVALALLDYPSVLGRWEGFVSFPLMQGPPPPLIFEITPGGYVYNRSLSRYALVD